MKIFKLPMLADLSDGNEYMLSAEDLGGSSAYMTYCRMRPKEPAKKMTTRTGHEEIVFMLKGAIRVRSGKSAFSVSSGEAFFSTDAAPLLLDNPGEEEAVYIIAGARAGASGKAQADDNKAKTQGPVRETTGETFGITESPVKEEAEEDGFEITQDDEEDTPDAAG